MRELPTFEGASCSCCVEQELSSNDMAVNQPQVGTMDLINLHDRPHGAGAQIAGSGRAPVVVRCATGWCSVRRAHG
jgi:hypothetical protein